KRINILSCFFFLNLVPPIFLSAQKISGRVLNEGGKAASHVTVQFRDKSNSVFTNEEGRFSITARQLPDSLFFSSPGFEPYKLLVTEQTVRDPNFEIVLLNTRRKIKSSDVAANATGTANNTSQNNTTSSKPSGINGQGSTTAASGSYISGKKLFMIDTVANSRSVIYRSGLLTSG